MLKTCTKCRVEKERNNFTRSRGATDGLNYVCKDCVRILYTARYVYCPERNRHAKLKKKYGITLADYTAMLDKQRNACAICCITAGKRRRLHVDHCHTTGRIRGLLCSNCNSGIGNLRDSTELLHKAIAYLEARGA